MSILITLLNVGTWTTLMALNALERSEWVFNAEYVVPPRVFFWICCFYSHLAEFQNVCLHLHVQSFLLWHCGVMVITTAQLHSTILELRFCAGSNPACVMEIRDGEDLWQWSWLKIRLNVFHSQPYHNNISSFFSTYTIYTFSNRKFTISRTSLKKSLKNNSLSWSSSSIYHHHRHYTSVTFHNDQSGL